MLDNVIDINYYAVAKARNSNLKHRPVGLGIMGFQDCLHLRHTPYASDEAMSFADRSMEAVCYYAYWASTELAEERGRYATYKGSLWDRGVMPQDSLKLLRDERGGYVEVDESVTMDWGSLRARIKEHGMRNSNCIAIAPTATISNIVGVGGVDRARVPEHLREVEPVGRVHGGQRAPGRRAQEAEPVGRGDGRRPQVLRRLARQDRPHAGGAAPASTRRRSKSTPSGSSKPARAARSGSTRRSRSTSTWRARRARSSTTSTSSRGCAASRPRTTCAPWARPRPRSPPARAASSTRCRVGAAARRRRQPSRRKARPRRDALGAGARSAKFCSIDNPDCEACQ